MRATQLNWLSACDAAQTLRDGAISSEQLVEACLARVRQVDANVQAWAFLDPEHALAQARALDERRKEGASLGPLHGVPVGIKDIFDTADMPTEDGTVLHAGRTPATDAAAVARLRAAGAVIMGKTVTTELATYAPGKTRNPHNAEHTPGGSSSGSAAAVACGMVPLALGSQTNGSVIRPAAYCGVYGFKPTHGLISRHGVLKLSRALDHAGVFARTIEDIALACEELAGFDERDPDTRMRARIPFLRIAAEEPPFPPRLAFVKTPLWDRTEPDTREAFAELVAQLGDRVEEFVLPESAREALEWHRTIMEAEMAANLVVEYDRGRDQLSDSLRAQLERGRKHTAFDYQAALARVPLLNEGFAELFERYDAIVTPATAGTAPKGLASTGDPAFCTLWTLCGMPALSLPLMQGANGLPLGLQLIGPRHDDARLLRTARWLAATVETD
ncbi:MAG TPA: amidase [Burkholderiales bacterium]|jgi:Asp-tRNA(Asn)/Glu-tRNA(Gln) amidotransferase A subunit family amidase